MKNTFRSRSFSMCLVLVTCLAIGLSLEMQPRELIVSPKAKHIGHDQALSFRPIEGRITGMPFYAPYRPSRASIGAQGELDPTPILRRGTVLLQESIISHTRSRGAEYLFAGQSRRAIIQLEKDLQASPDNARLLSDLAAAYLDSLGEPEHLVRALASADRAVKKQPDLPEAWFNLALCLEHLGVLRAARTTWERYLNVDQSSQWAGEARSRVDKITKVLSRSIWEERLAQFERVVMSSSLPDVRGLVAASPQSARLYAEEVLLPKWGESVCENKADVGRRSLIIARQIGAELVRYAGDRMLHDSVATIDNATAAHTQQILARGHRSFGVALRAIRAGDYQSAYSPLLEAKGFLVRGRSPFRDWASFYLALSDYQYSEYGRALFLLDEVQSQARNKGYKSLEGRALWLRGTILVFQSRYTESFLAYQQSRRIFLTLGESQNLVATNTLLAKNLALLGDHSGAWEYRIEALREVARNRDAHRLRVTLAEAAWAIADMGKPEAALYLQEEATQTAEEMRDPLALTPALRQLSAILFRTGDFEGAMTALDKAKEAASALPDAGIRKSLDTEAAIIAAEIARERNPRAAIENLTEAINNSLGVGDRLFLPSLYLGRARALRILGDQASAEEDLKQALGERESQREKIRSDLHRLSFFDLGEEIVAEMVDLQVNVNGSFSRALDYVEANRARVLSDWLFEIPGKAGINEQSPYSEVRLLSSSKLRRKLPQGSIVVEYFMGKRGLCVWVVSHDRIIYREMGLNSEEVDKLVLRLRELIKPDGSVQLLRLLADFYDYLVRPIENHLPQDASLIIIPDGPLESLPFAALFDKQSGKYLFERWRSTRAPSLVTYFWALSRNLEIDKFSSENRGILVLGDPAFDRTMFQHLPRLPYAMLEAERIADKFVKAELISGVGATKDRFLDLSVQSAVIHFAGHALVNSRNPLLSMLLMAPDHNSEDKGILYMHEIAARRLPDTELVVLSACSTASGKSFKAEGVLSLARAFLAAGVPSVIASAWDIDDRASAEFFERFYERLAKGESPSLALRSVRQEMVQEGRGLTDLYVWAAYDLIGGAPPPPS